MFVEMNREQKLVRAPPIQMQIRDWVERAKQGCIVLRGKLLQPNHLASLDELAQAISKLAKRENESPKPIQWNYGRRT